MRYQITHQTAYIYSEPVALAPHMLRLRPRSDANQQLHRFDLSIEPAPVGQSAMIDLDGNSIHKVWFSDTPVSELLITTVSEVETLCTNPFAYLLDPWAVNLPPAYSDSPPLGLQPYLAGYLSKIPGAIDPVAAQLAQEVWYEVSGNTVAFLSTLNQRIYEHCGYTIRETGGPFPPGVTWTKKSGSCRDVSVLFMEACRAMGLAARFVSGYQEGDVDTNDRHLHAWAEVYLPGAGWRGFDPTHGLAVSDRHIALVACPHPQDAAPITGTLLKGGVRSQMTYTLKITGHEPTEVTGDRQTTSSLTQQQS
ncbi:MAG: transglutaminase family protein [Synechococcales cyanobacterium T60_A2020_003]|nr:transglutaminase family protein [Synechococcales cyanobacterium T60_A2020_003]